jgi:hypothetical protein
MTRSSKGTQQQGQKSCHGVLPGYQFRVEHIVRWSHQAADIDQGLGQFVVSDRRVDALTQFAVRQVGIEQHPARIGQRRGGLIQILQRAQPGLAVGLLCPVEQLAQQQIEHIEGVVVRAGFQAVDERHQRGDTPRIGQPRNGGDLDGVGEARQCRDAAWRHRGAGQFDAQATHSLNALQGLHERRGTNAHRPLAQPVKPGLAAAFDGCQ